jgi:hypothetical protein
MYLTITPDRPKDEHYISSKYRGFRYGFAHEGRYLPLLDKYVNEYYQTDPRGNRVEYYGYSNANIIGSTFVYNIITNADASSKDGWGGINTSVEVVRGRWNNGSFQTDYQDYLAGNGYAGDYSSYVKCTLNKDKYLFNNGLFDSRAQIGEFVKNEQWAFTFKVLNSYKRDVTSSCSAIVKEMVLDP